MRVSYDRLFKKLKTENITQRVFRVEAGLSGSTLTKLLHGQNTTTDNICRVCDYFHCMPDEIMEWIPEQSDEEKKMKEKAELENQLKEIQAKLDSLQ